MKIIDKGRHHWDAQIICPVNDCEAIFIVESYDVVMRGGGVSQKTYGVCCPICGKFIKIGNLPLWVEKKAYKTWETY